MYDTHILSDEGCQSLWEHGKKIGYCVNLKINYYRGLPMSCIDEITLVVDGEPVAPEQMLLQHNGRELPYLDILKDDFSTEFYWIFGEKVARRGEARRRTAAGSAFREVDTRDPQVLHPDDGRDMRKDTDVCVRGK